MHETKTLLVSTNRTNYRITLKSRPLHRKRDIPIGPRFLLNVAPEAHRSLIQVIYEFIHLILHQRLDEDILTKL